MSPASDHGANQAAKRSYEAGEMVATYLDFHFGPPGLGLASFHRTVAELCRRVVNDQGAGPGGRVVDLGCGPGRIAFELAALSGERCHEPFDEVVGVDLSAAFIDVARQLGDGATISYDRRLEGHRTERCAASLADLGLARPTPSVEFLEADAIDFLATSDRPIDLLVVANLLDRVYDPTLLVERCVEATAPGGVIVITSPFTWLSEYTSEENWLGSAMRPGREHLGELLGHRCRLAVEPVDVPFVIAETERKYQYVRSWCGAWVRE